MTDWQILNEVGPVLDDEIANPITPAKSACASRSSRPGDGTPAVFDGRLTG